MFRRTRDDPEQAGAVPASPTAPSTLLSDAFRSTRPTHPILAIVLVPLFFLVGQLVGTVVLLPLTGASLTAFLLGRVGLAEQLTLTLSFLGTAALLAVWLRQREHRGIRTLGFAPRTAVVRKLTVGALVGIATLVTAVLLVASTGHVHLTAEPGAFTPARWIGMLAALVGFAVQGATEEITTRGFLLQTLYRRWGLAAAIVGQALVFTAMHAVNAGLSWVSLVNLILIGMLLAAWALREGGLYGVCAFHAVWNWAQGNVFGIDVSGMRVRTTLLDATPAADSSTLLTGGTFGIEGSLATTLVLLVGAVVAVVLFRRRARS